MGGILKGWCASIRWADKLINSDSIHTSQGHPIYFECTDNFDDLRARFLPLIGRLRRSLEWSQQRVLTFTIDRNIYSNDVFHQVLADPFIHLITWEKGDQSEHDIPWKILTAQLAHLTTDGLTLPDGSGRPLQLRLTRKEQISVRIDDTPQD